MGENINLLIEKYDTKQPGENWTREHETNNKRYQRNRSKHDCADIIMQDLPLNGDTKLEVHYLIDKYSNFNKINTHLSRESIICCFCYYVMRSHNSTVRLEDYHIFTIYNIDYECLSIVFSNMLKLDNESSFLKPRLSVIK